MQRIWRAHGLAPHRVRQFKFSNDPDFVAKLRDVVGLYLRKTATVWAPPRNRSCASLLPVAWR